MAFRLTDTAIRAALAKAATTGERRDLADQGQDGLRLRVTPGGAASWVLACRDPQGRMRRFPLGGWPALGLSDARERARSVRVKVREGADPIDDARKLRAIGRNARAGIGTFAALLDLYGGPVVKKNAPAEASPETGRKRRPVGPGGDLKTWPETRRKMEVVFADLLRRPLATMTATDFQMAANAYPSKATAAAAVRYVRPVLKWAATCNYVPLEAALIVPPARVKRRDRVLTREELRALLPALTAPDASSYARAMRFMLLTVCRRDEAAEAVWRDVDLEAAEWRIPETKNGQPHRLPLSRQAVELLRGIGPGRPGDRVFCAPGGGKLVNWDRATKALMKATGTTGWTRHDLRRTGATLLGEMGVEPHVIEAALNHVSIHSQLAATYNRARYFPAVTAALQLLGDHLDGIAAGGAVVVPLAAGRKRGSSPVVLERPRTSRL